MEPQTTCQFIYRFLRPTEIEIERENKQWENSGIKNNNSEYSNSADP